MKQTSVRERERERERARARARARESEREFQVSCESVFGVCGQEEEEFIVTQL